MKRILLAILLLNFLNVRGQSCDLEFSLGNDTLINCNSSLLLQAPEGYEYSWSTNATTSTINVSQPGEYSVEVIETQESVVVNGDFSGGSTGFISSYIPGTGGSFGLLSSEGQYAVASNSSEVHDNFALCYDHTVGEPGGSMLIVNGAAVPNQNVWGQTVSVAPNTTYIFSIWGMSVVNGSPGQLNFSINGSQIGTTFNLSPTPCLWQNFYVTWDSGLNESAGIAIVNQNTSVGGNDFALDDIIFSPVCTFSDTIQVSLPPSPILTLSENQSICAGDSITLTAESSIEGSSFLWQPGALEGESITVAPNATIQYTAIAISPQSCNSQAQSTIITVVPGPEITIAGNDTVCSGELTTLIASSPNNTMIYHWAESDGETLTVSPEETTTYTVVGTPEIGCPAEQEFTIHVRNPLIDISGMDLICPGQTIELTASSYYNEFEYSWQPGDVSGNTITVAPQETTTYSVQGSSPAGCFDEQEFTVNVNEAEIQINGSANICPGDTAELSATANFEGFSYTWSPGNIFGANVSLSPEETTTYTINGLSTLGCSAQAEFTLNINPIPTVEILGDSAICSGGETVLTAISSSENSSFLWSTESTSAQITVSPNQTSEYSVIAFNGTCASLPVNYFLTVNSNPLVYPPLDTLICPESELVLSANSNVDNARYFWSPGELTGSTIAISPEIPGLYSVYAVDENNCRSFDGFFYVDFLPSCGCTLTLPSIFTPNGDGRNEIFGPAEDEECNYTNYSFRIYNRWGKEIWNTSDATKRWDGTNNGNESADGVYFYEFSYSFTDGSGQTGVENLSGQIMLNR